MRVLVIGAGNVGAEVARHLTARGDHVVATTTTTSRVPEVEAVASEAVVLVGADRRAVAEAADGSDAIVVTVSPPVSKAMTADQREASYREVLAETCRSAIAANARTIFLSSISVYGDAADEITEDSPLARDADPSARWFAAAEDAVLASPDGAVLRAPDIYGHPNDIDFTTRVRYAHSHFGGSVPFSAGATFNRLHHLDAVGAVVHLLDRGLAGVFNVVPPAIWGCNSHVFDRLAAEAGLDGLEFRGELTTPEGPISSRRLVESGFVFGHVEESVE